MFTIEQIRAAHSKVRSGADFPAYIQDIKALGVTHYVAFVTDGHVDYHGANQFTVSKPASEEARPVADLVREEAFRAALAAHQQGKTDYARFILDCAENGIEKWEVSLLEMTCTYFDKAGRKILTEAIPQ